MNRSCLVAALIGCGILFGCSQDKPSAQNVSEAPLANSPTAASDDPSPPLETNCPPANWIDTASLKQPQIDALFKIADFSMDGQITREEFASNQRYLEVALFGAQFLSNGERALKDIIDVTGTPPLSVKGAAKLSAKLLTDDGTGYARSGLMGSLQNKTKTCFFMVKFDQG